MLEPLKAGRHHRRSSARRPATRSSRSTRSTRRRCCRGSRRARRSGTGWRRRKQAAEFAKYLQKLRAQAIIEWKNDELKKMYDQKVAEEAVPAAPPAEAADASADEEGRDEVTPTRRLISDERRRTACLARGSPSGRGRAPRRSSTSSSSGRASRSSSRPSPAGAAGRTAARRSTGRCFPATASRGSTRATRCSVLNVHRRRDDRVVRRQAGADSRRRSREHPPPGDERPAVRPVPVHQGRRSRWR